MAEIKAADVAKLRQMTSAGMMDCKNALVEANGDFERAQEIIRERGKMIAAKRADRETSEGTVIAKVCPNGTAGVIVALGCETDFVAINKDFVALAHQLSDVAVKQFPKTIEEFNALTIDGQTIKDLVSVHSGKNGEKHSITYKTIEGAFLVSYIHMNNKLASIVAFNKVIPTEAGKDIAMQVAAMNPVSLSKEDCPSSVIESELAVGREQARQENKPEAMIEKIAQGKLAKFYKEQTLNEQTFVKDGKISVSEYLKGVDADVKISGFIRISLND